MNEQAQLVRQLFSEAKVPEPAESKSVENDPPPYGKYQAVVWSVRNGIPEDPQKAPYFMWKFRIAAGPHKDKFITKFNHFRTPKNMEMWLKDLSRFGLGKPAGWDVEDWTAEQREKVVGTMVEINFQKQPSNPDYDVIYINRSFNKADKPAENQPIIPTQPMYEEQSDPVRPEPFNDEDIPW